MSTLHEGSGHSLLFSKGAPEAIIPLCDGVELANGLTPLSAELREHITMVSDQMAAQGLRVLALAWRNMSSSPENFVPPAQALSSAQRNQDSFAGQTINESSERDLTFAGLIGLEDRPRTGVAEAIQTCRGAVIGRYDSAG